MSRKKHVCLVDEVAHKHEVMKEAHAKAEDATDQWEGSRRRFWEVMGTPPWTPRLGLALPLGGLGMAALLALFLLKEAFALVGFLAVVAGFVFLSKKTLEYNEAVPTMINRLRRARIW